MTSPLIFITGATGFIGSYTIDASLQAGYRVRLSIRKPEQESMLRKLFPAHESSIETVVIPDLSKQEAFKDALKDVEYVFHIASPMPFTGSDLMSHYVDPAVKATEAILYAALEAPQMKKVIVMSSGFSLVDINMPLLGPVVARENTGEVLPVDLSDPRANTDDIEGSGFKYRASKILAHQATRDFLVREKPHYTLLTFHPSFVLGHDMLQNSATEIRGMNTLLWMSIQLEKPLISGSWVHVKDIADAHIKAIGNEVPTGTEFILCGPTFPWEEAVEFVNKEYPWLDCKLTPPYGPLYEVQVSAAEKYLGIKWIEKEQIMREVFDQQIGFTKKE